MWRRKHPVIFNHRTEAIGDIAAIERLRWRTVKAYDGPRGELTRDHIIGTQVEESSRSGQDRSWGGFQALTKGVDHKLGLILPEHPRDLLGNPFKDLVRNPGNLGQIRIGANLRSVIRVIGRQKR